MHLHEDLVLHFLMDKYGGYPDRWLEQDWDKCMALLDVNSIIQNVQKRERKKQEFKQKRKRKKKKRGKKRKR